MIGLAVTRPTLLRRSLLDHGDDVDRLAVPHRVMDEMRLGREPEPDRVAAREIRRIGRGQA